MSSVFNKNEDFDSQWFIIFLDEFSSSVGYLIS